MLPTLVSLYQQPFRNIMVGCCSSSSACLFYGVPPAEGIIRQEKKSFRNWEISWLRREKTQFRYLDNCTGHCSNNTNLFNGAYAAPGSCR